ncbi:bifunctional 23S rRNA (guanine(2069)-N(7))-methyltransferase RlmK/23S rRNA (guanine(2445)-N(2))-methyltransferase RlmL [Pseudohaliea rubra]|uniref:Ribosomal RNA large subunit methyltransferase K/L n=1 Tax=Pseudohaliea rubra DSM 19751 TaxID=1265313 RepID=A0A095VS65_9GAMM|nr:bifunctional 23S rRNA (guanine(2069)-N(7))-methyltransferase RlmK/23S rRNA (guanine(2445)-N(2))-methyltransferase RlmL [Pseudohaliea rubra]KGE04297.1 23S rRNA (guanine N2)-methyltransferase [Pseudohaliea rubra DSM 19751]
MEQQHWLAICPRGIAPLLVEELEALGAEDAREQGSAVSFRGARSVFYRACLWSRLANRVLLPLGDFPAADGDTLYASLRSIDWPRLLAPGASIAVDFHGQNGAIRHSRFGAQRSKDAVVDSCREAGLARPSVDLERPDLRISVQLRRDQVAVALDLTGGSLHQRGYRERSGAAPLKENLAAAVLLRAGWPAMVARGGALIDPMCGAGTLLIEGALMALDRAPGLERRHWGFAGWRGHDEAQWRAVLGDARLRAEHAARGPAPEIRGYDADPRVVRIAQEAAASLGLGKVIRVSCKALAEVKRPTHRPLPEGVVVCNPPYGERLGDRESLPYLYGRLGQVLHDEFTGWQAAVLTGDRELGRAMGLRSHQQYALYNGALPVTLLLFELVPDNRWNAGAALQTAVPSAPAPSAPAGETTLGEGAAMFANRVRKNEKRLRSWRRREGINAYRVYDADMPEYAVAVDCYGDRVQVAEYAAPKGVDPAAAARRLDDVRAALPGALAVPPEQISYKTRQRQRGSEQYRRQGRSGEFFPVREGPASLLVNLQDYLDTGLFLDHRPLRLRIGAEAKGRDFLNLFCYTGTATVHAALGGARSTTSIDLSNTYLGWLRRNLAENGLAEGRHRLLRADVRAWLADAEAAWDLILLDPPSFSNSAAMDGSFDLQRDHRALVAGALACLRPGGVLYFSNNLRRFRLDPALADLPGCEDITAATIDPDFARRPRVHHCFRFQKPAGER